MKKSLLLFLTLCAFGNDQFAQLIDVWKNGTDMMTYDRKRAYEAPSGNILLARMDDYYGIGDGNDLLRCFDADGALLWSFGEEDFGDDSGSNFIDIAFDSESNAYVAGANFPQAALYPKTEVIKISPTGEELWRINFTQQSMWAEEVFEIEISEDNRIFLFATLFNADAETIIPHFIEIDTDGETVHFQPDINFDFGQGLAQVVQQVLGLGREMVGDVDQRQRGRTGIRRQDHQSPQLGQHQTCGHAPLRVGGMAVGKEFHAARRRAVAWRAGSAGLALGGTRVAALGEVVLAEVAFDA